MSKTPNAAAPVITLVTALVLLASGLAGQEAIAAPAQSAERPVSLERALNDALTGNADLVVAEARAEIAAQEGRVAAAPLWPLLSAEAGYLRSIDPVVAFGTKLRRSIFGADDFDVDRLNEPDPVEDWSAGIAARWTILDPRVWAGKAAASHRARSQAWSATRAREATVFATHALYYRARHARERARAARASVDAAAATLKIFRERHGQGLITEAEVLGGEAELAAAEAALSEAERARADALQELGLHLGWSPDSVPVPSDSLRPPAPSSREPFDPERRADVRALAAASDAADAARRRARLDLLPALEVTAAYAKHSGGPFSSDATDWTVDLRLRWPLFTGFARAAEIRRSGLEGRIREVEYAEAAREALTEVDRARRAVETARTRVEATRAARAAAESSRDLMRRRFDEGLATAADLLSAEARLVDMRDRALAARAEYWIAVAGLDFVRSQIESGGHR